MTKNNKTIIFLLAFLIFGNSSYSIPPFLLLDDYYSMKDDNTKHFCFLENDVLPAGTFEVKIIKVEKGSTDPDISDVGLDGSNCFKYKPDDSGTAIITYQVCYTNPDYGCKTAKIYLRVFEGSVPEPTANHDLIFTQKNTPTQYKVDTNDFPGGGTFTITSGAKNGSANWTSTKGQIRYTPDNNFIGKDSVQYKINIGAKQSFAWVYIYVGIGNEAPVVQDISKNGNEDTSINFTAADFNSKFSDQDNVDILQKIKVASLPTKGNLRLNSSNISVNQEIEKADFAKISYVPNLNFNGQDFFLWNGSDGNEYAVNNANVNINVVSVNDKPTIGDFNIATNEDTKYTFKFSEFASIYSDVDGDPLSSIKVTTLPSKGNLKIENSDVILNEVISANNLSKLNYIPNNNYSGADSFLWQGSDGIDISSVSAKVIIAVNAVNDAPVLSNFIIKGTEDIELKFNTFNFNNNYSDVENEPIKFVKITTLPANGLLNFNNTNVTKDQEIAVADLSKLSFIPNENFFGTSSFDWNASDGKVYSTNGAKVNIQIDPVNDPPVMRNNQQEAISIVSFQSLENEKLNICLNLYDPDQDEVEIKKILVRPNHGTIENLIQSSHCFTYASNKDYYGDDQLEVEFCDNGTQSLCNKATIKIQITHINNPPEFIYNGSKTDVIRIRTEREKPVDFCWEVKDPEGSSLKPPTIVAQPGNGQLSNFSSNNTCLSYTPAKRFAGNDKAVLEYCDTENPSACSRLIIEIEVTPWDPVIAYEVITPNGDTENQAWHLDGIEKYPENAIQIYNRWGSLVYQVRGYNNESKIWKGESNIGNVMGSNILPDGTYYFLIDLGDGSKPMNGYVVIIR